MLLYKYISDVNFKNYFFTPLQNKTPPSFSFTRAKYLNDPFELESIKLLYSLYGIDKTMAPIKELEKDVPIRKQKIAHDFCILSLTHTPFNKLMWSHYASNYNGFVIGIEVELADLNNHNKYLTTASFGSVIYRNAPPKIHASEFPNLLKIIRAINNKQSYNHTVMQQMFLCKDICWSYEEEVRIVGFGNTLKKSNHQQHEKGFALALPEDSIKEIYYSSFNRDGEINQKLWSLKNSGVLNQATIYRLEQVNDSYEINGIPSKQGDRIQNYVFAEGHAGLTISARENDLKNS